MLPLNAFVSLFLAPCPLHHQLRRSSTSPSRAPKRPSTARNRRFAPACVFLPPGGPPKIPDDDSEDEEEQRARRDTDLSESTEPKSGSSSISWGSESSLDTLGSVAERLDSYDTWERANRQKSVSTIRGRSELLLGADELNESLGPRGTERLRLVLAPDEAFGALFNWNAVICNARELELECWKQVAREEGLMEPDLDDIIKAETMAPEAAVERVFFWKGGWSDIKKWCFRKYEIMKELEQNFQYRLCSGLKMWMKNLDKYGVNYVICSPLPREQMERILKDTDLKDESRKLNLVSNEDEYDTLEQMYLLAALKAGKPPQKCVIFTDRPAEITAGHETSAKVVGIIGTHPAYEIKTADLSVRDYDELVIYNIRKLFSELGQEFMDPVTELEKK